MTDNRSRYKSRFDAAASRQHKSSTSVSKKSSVNDPLSYRSSPLVDNVHSRHHQQRADATEPPIIVAHPSQHSRKMSIASTSSSDYSEESDSIASTSDAFTEGSSSVKKRSGASSEGGADRRRVAIVQMQTLQEAMNAPEASSSTSSLRSRRGLATNLAGLALVAPPDAALNSYTQLTPPSTAPITATTNRLEAPRTGHHRSTSETAPTGKASSRDVDGIRTALHSEGSGDNKRGPLNKDTAKKNNNNNTNLPNFDNNTTLRPAVLHEAAVSRFASPAHSAVAKADDGQEALSPVNMYGQPSSTYAASAVSSAFSFPRITTPEIGASKEIHIPVAAPVVVDLTSRNAVQTRSAGVASRSNSPYKLDAISNLQRKETVAVPAKFVADETSVFLTYQPGLHATAGPLPPPPRAAFAIDMHAPPPPRPPRLCSPAPSRMQRELEAVKQALQLPPSVTSKLAKTISQVGSVTPLQVPRQQKSGLQTTDEEKDSPNPTPATDPVHRREGAFPSPSAKCERLPEEAEDSTKPSISQQTEPKAQQPLIVEDDEDHVPEVTVIEEPKLKETTEEEAEEAEGSLSLTGSWMEVHQEDQGRRTPSPESSKRGTSLEDDARRRRSFSPSTISSGSPSQQQQPLSPRSSSSTAPSPPPKSFRNSLTTNLKRFSSLPKAPSLSARRANRSSTSTRYSSRTPSPTVPLKPPRHKIIDRDPAAMFCHEVYQQRTAAERCAIYVAKINELYVHDCGLSEWVLEMKYRGTTSQSRAPSTQSFQQQPRHTSRSSMISEATFPRRPDAVTATDLSSQGSSYRDISPSSVAINLPYPTLATQQRQQSIRSTSSAGSGTPPSVRSLAPSNASSKTGFFASLGRKASLSGGRRERTGPALGATSIAARGALIKPPPTTKDISRPILIANTNTVGGPTGPRALPHRATRSQTLMIHPSPPFRTEREELGRRPSLFDLGSDGAVQFQEHPEFTQQVDKLQSLLPHADRTVLAGYLYRAGQDVLAIGQYLEDEKNGTIRYV